MCKYVSKVYVQTYKEKAVKDSKTLHGREGESGRGKEHTKSR